jgi:hypothetical protein
VKCGFASFRHIALRPLPSCVFLGTALQGDCRNGPGRVSLGRHFSRRLVPPLRPSLLLDSRPRTGVATRTSAGRDDGGPMEAAPAVKPRRQSPTRPPCDTTPALSPGQPEPGNWGRRDLSALPDRKSRRVRVQPVDHRVRLPCVKTLAPTRHRHRRERHVHVRAG